MAAPIYDVVVVGAGVEGSATAYYLAKRGKKTLLLEQFSLPHNRGSSHGQSRIFRKSYLVECYTEMMVEATEAWSELEREAGLKIYKQHGYLAIGPYKGELLELNARCLSSHNVTFQYLSPDEFRRRFPMLSYPENYGCILDENGGILHADRVLKAYQTMFKKYGGRLVDNTKVFNIKRGSIVALETSRATYRGRSVVICPGPWASKVLEPLGVVLPLETIRISVLYFRELHPGSQECSKIPAFFDSKCCGGNNMFGLPAVDYQGHVKICLHSGTKTDPDTGDEASDKHVIDMSSQYVKQHMPFLETTPSISEKGIYTMTPDRRPVLDTIPGSKNIAIGVGFSGHGFKLAPVVGKVLGQLALGETPSYSLTPFRIDRFSRRATYGAKRVVAIRLCGCCTIQ